MFGKYFSAKEFDSPDAPGSGDLMHEDFISRLIIARTLAGMPFVINSGYRTKERNTRVGGVANSSHLIGRAADIATKSSADRFKILTALIDAGFDRIGIGQTFLHVDDDPTKSLNKIWTYK